MFSLVFQSSCLSSDVECVVKFESVGLALGVEAKKKEIDEIVKKLINPCLRDSVHSVFKLILSVPKEENNLCDGGNCCGGKKGVVKKKRSFEKVR